MLALAQKDTTNIPPKVRGVQWVQQPSGFFISLLFPWGFVDARLLHFAPHYAMNRTLPLRDAQFWMWSVIGIAHYQLKNIQQTAYCADWQKDFYIACEHCVQGIESVSSDLERCS
ncbi:MAG: hypothetical protein ACK5XN_04150 [Bacteroidota bacterium]|jgi:hypothetical protein